MLDGIFGVLEEQQSRASIGGELPLSRSRVPGSFGLIEQQKRDGEVCRPEFSPDYGVDGWPLLSDPAARQKLETFVLRNCIPERHRYRLADGGQGVVYFDARGRATSSRLTEVPDAELARMAREAGKSVNGRKADTKPQTGRRDHGYRGAVQEGDELDEAKYHVDRQRLFGSLKNSVVKILTARTEIRDLHEMLTRIANDATGMVWTDNYRDPQILKVAKQLYQMDHEMGSVYRAIEGLESKMKKMVPEGGSR